MAKVLYGAFWITTKDLEYNKCLLKLEVQSGKMPGYKQFRDKKWKKTFALLEDGSTRFRQISKTTGAKELLRVIEKRNIFRTIVELHHNNVTHAGINKSESFCR